MSLVVHYKLCVNITYVSLLIIIFEIHLLAKVSLLPKETGTILGHNFATTLFN